MAKVRPDTATAAGREGDGLSLRGRRRSYLLAFTAVLAIKITALIWLLGYAGPALLYASGGD
jgi:hypothetical protein